MVSKNTKVIVDTGFFVALFSKSDQFHSQALATRPLIEKRRWYTTWPVLTEVCYLLGQLSSGATDSFIALFENDAFSVFDLGQQHASSIRQLMSKYKDLPMNLADASLVILAQEINCGDIVSTDQRDFGLYRFKNREPFCNLMK